MQHMNRGSRMRAAAAATLLAGPLVFAVAPAQASAQATPAPAASAQAAAAQAQPLPSGRVLMAQFNKALGGSEAFAKLQSVHMVGTMNMGPMSVGFESWSARPNRSVTNISANGMNMSQGFDGTVGWAMNPAQGAVVLSGDELAAAKDAADFESMMRDTADYKTIETVEKTTLDGRECFKVRVVSLKDVESFDCYAVDTHLLVGTVATSPEIGETSTFLREYRTFGGILFPTQMVMSAPMGQQEMTMTTIEVNSVDPAKFALPPEVQALVKK